MLREQFSKEQSIRAINTFKNKTYEEIMGEEKAKILKRKKERRF